MTSSWLMLTSLPKPVLIAWAKRFAPCGRQGVPLELVEAKFV